MSDYIQRIGNLLKLQNLSEKNRALLYAEVNDGTIESAIFLHSSPEKLIFRYLSTELEDLIYEFWEHGNNQVTPQSWRSMEYLLHGQAFDLRFGFPDEFKKHENAIDRRPRLLQRYFQGAKVDYSNPGA